MIKVELLEAIQKAGGRATVSDLVAATTHPAQVVTENILPALSLVGGHVAVDDNGELIYSVERRRALPQPSRWSRVRRKVLEALKFGFWASWTVLLLSYFIFYIVLIIAMIVAAIAAASRGGDCDCDCDCGGNACGGCNSCGDTCFVCGSDKRRFKRTLLREEQRERKQSRRLQREAQRVERRRARSRKSKRRRGMLSRFRDLADREGLGRTLGLALPKEEVADKPPFLKAVRDFVFGTPRADVDLRARDRNFLAFIKAHVGRMTAADAVSLTGLSIDQADAVLLDVAGRFEGDVEVTDDGVIVYTFDRLLVSASADHEVLDWVLDMGGSVTVNAFAERFDQVAEDAYLRLQHLSRLVDGRVAHGDQTRFVFPPDAQARLVSIRERNEALRDYTYCWEQLEVSPKIIGLPVGKAGWVVGLNIVNLVMAFIVTGFYVMEDFPEVYPEVLAGPGLAWVVGYLPLLFSTLVFLIPLARTVGRAFGDRGRRRRNARRAVLVALFHHLEEVSDRMSARQVRAAFDDHVEDSEVAAVQELLDTIALEMEGSVDHEAGVTASTGYTYVFTRLHEELKVIKHERLEVDVTKLALAAVVYDTSAPLEESAAQAAEVAPSAE